MVKTGFVLWNIGGWEHEIIKIEETFKPINNNISMFDFFVYFSVINSWVPAQKNLVPEAKPVEKQKHWSNNCCIFMVKPQ